MHIYTEHNILFEPPHFAKMCLDDSMTRTQNALESMGEGTWGSVAYGCGNFILARVESATAFAVELLSLPIPTALSFIATPCFLIPAAILDLGSRLPGISSFESVQSFTNACDDLIYRTIRVHFLAIPVITLSLVTTFLNTFIPLARENCLLSAMHWTVSGLGNLKTIEARVRGYTTHHHGTIEPLSLLEIAEEFLRAHSVQNYPSEVVTDWLTYTITYYA